jgi:hypothetical protein
MHNVFELAMTGHFRPRTMREQRQIETARPIRWRNRDGKSGAERRRGRRL